MLLTYCRNEEGHERLFVTGHGSVTAWIEPTTSSDGEWVFHCQQSPTDMTPDFEVMRAAPVRQYLFAELARLAGVATDDLNAVPFHAFIQFAAPMPEPLRQRVPRERRREAVRGWRIVDAHTP